MKRLRRWLFNLAAAASVLAFVASIIFWERSHRGGDRLEHVDTKLYWVFESWEGQFSFASRSGAAITRTVGITLPNRIVDVQPANDSETSWQALAFQPCVLNSPGRFIFHLDDGSRSFYQLAIGLPHWFVAIVAAILPNYWLATLHARFRRWRRTKGLCPACGCDLRATPERCPECGAIPGRCDKPILAEAK